MAKKAETKIYETYIKVSGVKEEDELTKSMVNAEINRFLKKTSKIYGIKTLSINIEKHKKGGKRAKYSAKSTLFTSKGSFFAQAHEWDLPKAVKDVLDILESTILKDSKRRGS